MQRFAATPLTEARVEEVVVALWYDDAVPGKNKGMGPTGTNNYLRLPACLLARQSGGGAHKENNNQ